MSISGGWEIKGEGILGWARDSAYERPLWVELLMDGEIIGVALARLAEPEGCGFWLPVPSIAFEQTSELRVRLANSNYFLPETVFTENKENGLLGQLLLDRGLTICGWAMDSLENEKKINLSAWINDEKVASVLARELRYRPEGVNGHGFTLHLPARFGDGKKYLVHVRDDRDRVLPGSPVEICLTAENASSWLAAKNRLDKNEMTLLADLLGQMEKRMPGTVPQSDLEDWKNAFPVPRPEGKNRIALAIFPEADRKAVLGGQIGLDLRQAEKKAEYFLVIQAGERLHPLALAHMLAGMKARKASMAYADAETRDGAYFKPAWDRDSFLAHDYLGPLLMTADVMEKACLDGTESYGAMRVKLVLAAEGMGGLAHVPLPLSRQEPVANDSGRLLAIQAWLDARHQGATVENRENAEVARIHYAIPRKPLVSVIIPTRDHADMLARCLESLELTEWPALEIIVVDNGSVEKETLALLERLDRKAGARVLPMPGIFNYSWLNNNAVREAAGELVCFLNNDTEITQGDWLYEMASLLLAAGEQGGCVGAKLLWPNGLVQHGGVVVGVHQLACHVGNQWLDGEAGYMLRNQIAQQYSAVTAACLLTRRNLFLELGGFDELDFPVNFNDVDYCLRLRSIGKKVFWTPYARLLHLESASRGSSDSPAVKARVNREMRIFRTRWGNWQDPFYNPNLPLSTVTEPFYGLAFPPGSRNAR